jgi:hypothetical protein
MTQWEQVLSTGDPNIDSANGHPIAYAGILQAAQSDENRPIFLKEDSVIVTSSDNADKVPLWMNIAAQVATGNRKMVLEDGPDKMNSDDSDALEDVKPDEEKGMYTPEMDPKQGPVKLTQAQAGYQRAAAQALKASTVPPHPQKPVEGSSDEDDPNGSERIWSQTKGCMRVNRHFREKLAAAAAPKKTNPFAPRSSTPVEDKPAPIQSVPPRSSTSGRTRYRRLRKGK